MRKYISFLMTALLALTTACEKDTTPLPEKDEAIPAPVDMGIYVKGKNVKWASHNLGATKESEIGNYYAWGATARYKNYDWRKYPWSNDDGTRFSKYCANTGTQASWWNAEGEADGLSVLLPEDDIAHKKLKGSWRMPTKEEVEALLATQHSPYYIWVKGYEMDGTVGVYISYTKDGVSQHIFLPLAGRRNGDQVEFDKERGYYASSTQSEGATGGPDGCFNLGLEKTVEAGLWSNSRCYGYSIRPVYVE